VQFESSSRKGAKAQRKKEHPEFIDSLGAFAPLREILIKLHHYRFDRLSLKNLCNLWIIRVFVKRISRHYLDNQKGISRKWNYR
jgi:hypothetical protein